MRTHNELAIVAHKAAAELLNIITNGLNPVYTDACDYMYDFWPSFIPWNAAEASAVASIILQDETMRGIVRAFDVLFLEPLDGVDDSSTELGFMLTISDRFNDR